MKVIAVLEMKHIAGLFPGSPKASINKRAEGAVVQ